VQKLEALPPPPGILNSIRVGFDIVSNRAVLIILPLVVDLFLWLGPRLSAGNISSVLLKDLLDFSQKTGPSAQDFQTLTDRVAMLGHINLFGWIQTFPIGVPTLFWGNLPETLPLKTPFGLQSVVQVSSMPGMLGWYFLLTFIGWIGGGLYFRWISETTLGEEEAKISSLRAIIQTLILSLIWLVSLTIILFPVAFVLGLISLLSPTLANGAVLVILMLSFWLIVPLFFMPHGIFTRKQNALHSIFASLKMARFTLPTSSLFVFSLFILYTGLNYLWSVPSNDSWMMLVGIAGHAFITTALLSASFVYYREMNDWLQNVYERFRQTANSK